MYSERFAWLPSVVDKILGKHNVSPEEVEEVFYGRPMVRFHEKGRVQGENMFAAFGQTDSGRYFMERSCLPNHLQLTGKLYQTMMRHSAGAIGDCTHSE